MFSLLDVCREVVESLSLCAERKGVAVSVSGDSGTMAGVEPGDRFISVTFGILTLAFGILIVARPEFIMNALMIYIGIFFVVSGLMDLYLIKRLGGI